MQKFKTFMMVFSLVILVSACSTKDEEMTPDTSLTTNERAPVTGFNDTANIDNQMLNGPASGSQQDLVVNVGDRVFFGYDQYDLRDDARSTVDRQAQWMKANPSVRILIEGHCDERGTREYNLALGDKRAQSVRNYLVALGVSADRIETISYGKERPVGLGSDSSSWAQNRRGVAIVQ